MKPTLACLPPPLSTIGGYPSLAHSINPQSKWDLVPSAPNLHGPCYRFPLAALETNSLFHLSLVTDLTFLQLGELPEHDHLHVLTLNLRDGVPLSILSRLMHLAVTTRQARSSQQSGITSWTAPGIIKGLGIKRLNLFHHALLGPAVQRFLNRDFSPWVLLMQAKYGNFPFPHQPKKCSSLWRSLCKVHRLLIKRT